MMFGPPDAYYYQQTTKAWKQANALGLTITPEIWNPYPGSACSSEKSRFLVRKRGEKDALHAPDSLAALLEFLDTYKTQLNGWTSPEEEAIWLAGYRMAKGLE